MDTDGINVLVVDDDEEEYVVVRKYLKRAQAGLFHVHWAPTIDEALAAMQSEEHDVCLLDYHLGERTGIEVLREVRALGCDIPVILLTGQGSLELDLEAMQMGACDYMEKGDLTPVVLDRSIRYTIENHRARVALRKANEELEQRVRERTTELDRSNRDLEQFANIVAQDLQEPLRAMTQYIGAIRARVSDRPEEAAREQVGKSMGHTSGRVSRWPGAARGHRAARGRPTRSTGRRARGAGACSDRSTARGQGRPRRTLC